MLRWILASIGGVVVLAVTFFLGGYLLTDGEDEKPAAANTAAVEKKENDPPKLGEPELVEAVLEIVNHQDAMSKSQVGLNNLLGEIMQEVTKSPVDRMNEQFEGLSTTIDGTKTLIEKVNGLADAVLDLKDVPEQMKDKDDLIKVFQDDQAFQKELRAEVDQMKSDIGEVKTGQQELPAKLKKELEAFAADLTKVIDGVKESPIGLAEAVATQVVAKLPKPDNLTAAEVEEIFATTLKELQPALESVLRATVTADATVVVQETSTTGVSKVSVEYSPEYEIETWYVGCKLHFRLKRVESK